ncbi:hypothetical protein GCM10010371_02190 [Streptomyces subrutilus]|uniref:DUF6801 domain-containing protein n=1 Tax=Streptomyces subrutilus TaxID=36818 RepID=A0A5P2UIM4_9ACTN|nr:DUF6801 domain-containing protein [Streptomyces subrutilus]QEU77334.1 hypothetical protein CP968_02645 [Streptomyces subrutilus]GGZ46581.1 hypothetical protein GCM10010371_02190 [Streptomyces subrutilus]
MTGHRPALRTPRGRARGAAIAAFVALAPLIPSAAAAVGSQEITAKLPYDCALPSGTQRAAVRVTAAFPDRAKAGEAIRPTGVTTTVELPAAAVADLTALKATTVVPETRLALDVAQHEAKAQALWRGTARPVPLPAEGTLTLTTTGDAPAVTAAADGDLTLTATGLAVDLALGTADGAPTAPPSLSLACTLAKDADGHGLLATVPIGPATGTPAPSGSPSPSAPTAPASGRPTDPASPSGSAAPGAPGAPGGKDKDKDKDKAPKVGDARAGLAADRPPAPPCVKENPTDKSLNAYITGYSNVRKLAGASLIPVSCVQIEQGDPEISFPPDGSIHLLQKSDAYLDYQGRKQTPPFTSTFLTFGFTPTTATMILEQAGPMTVASDVLLVFPDNIAETYVRAPLVLRVLNVEVNGTRLDVGPSCRTETPLSSPEPDPATYPGPHLVMLGKGQLINGTDATGYVLTSGGPLTGEVTIPAFTGCGAGGENLDRLLTASISGSGNYVKQIQGQTCAVGVEVPTEGQCTEDRQPYVVPAPER